MKSSACTRQDHEACHRCNCFCHRNALETNTSIKVASKLVALGAATAIIAYIATRSGA